MGFPEGSHMLFTLLKQPNIFKKNKNELLLHIRDQVVGY